MKRSFAWFAAILAAACQSTIPASGPISRERIAEIVASPDRSDADRTNDRRRQPELMLAFIGVRPGMVAMDLAAAGGYTTELIARAVGPSGKVYGQSAPPDPNRPKPAAPEGGAAPAPAGPRLTSAQLTTYFYGYSEMMKIRQAAQGAPGFSERAYHDRLLSHGSPGMRYIRAMMAAPQG